VVDQLTKGISSLAPFLEPYSSWVKVLFSLWVLLTAILLLSLILARPSRDKGSEQLPAVGDTRHDAVWLTIKRAELYGPLAGAEIRVTAKVNGTEFTYPTLEGVEWLGVGPQMASQQFRIPPATQYELQFTHRSAAATAP
jgi:hypothetical protein